MSKLGGRKSWWRAFGGTIAFVVVGLALTPLLLRHQSAPAPETTPLELPPRAAAARAAPAAEPLASPELPPPAAVGPEADTFDCMILPSEEVDLGSPITGRLEEIPVERSDYVEAGQVVARLESTVEQAAVRVAQARAGRTVDVESRRASLALGQQRRTRARELFERETLSLDLRQEVETEATLSELELERARENQRIAALELERTRAELARRTIRTPVSGYVVERLMTPGEVVDEETILRIAQVDPLRVEVILPSYLLGKVRAGDLATIVPEAPLDGPRAAQVALVDPVLDGASGTFGARLLLPNPDRELPAGLRCRVSFAAGPE